MKQVLYLTKEEMTLFQKLSQDLQSEWAEKIMLEMSTAYETQEELEKRMCSVDFSLNPAMVQFQKNLAAYKQSHGSTEGFSFADFPDNALPTLIETIGASGICAMIELSLQSGNVDDQALKGIAALSAIRHSILQRNSILA